jgi:hypothetical protein
MPINTTYNPLNLNDFEKTKINKNAQGVSIIIPAGTDVSIDLLLTDDTLVTGADCLVKGAIAGDTVDFQIYGPNPLTGISGVLNQFVTKWFINPDSTQQSTPHSNYPAKIPAGLTLRIIYHSTGTTDVWFAANYNLEKVLI